MFTLTPRKLSFISCSVTTCKEKSSTVIETYVFHDRYVFRRNLASTAIWLAVYDVSRGTTCLARRPGMLLGCPKLIPRGERVSARILAIANQKGGVGKTTTAVNIASGLAAAEKRVLLVDGDPQANATNGLGVSPSSFELSSYDVLLDPTVAGAAIVQSVHFESLDLMPATPDLAAAEIELVGEARRELRMRDALDRVRQSYEFVVIDCPPSLGLITLNMLAAADAVLIPLQCEYYALQGLSQLLRTIEIVQSGVSPDLVIDGVILTMFDSRLNLSRQVVEDARAHFGSLVFSSIIPRNIRLAEAPSFGKPIIAYDVGSVGAQAYLSVVRELIERTQTAMKPAHAVV